MATDSSSTGQSVPTASPVTSPTDYENSLPLTSGAIAGIAVGVAVSILLSLSVMAWYFARHRKHTLPEPKDIDSQYDSYTHDIKDVQIVKSPSGYSKLPATEMHGGLQPPQETYSNSQPRYERFSLIQEVPEPHGRVWYAHEAHENARFV